MKEGFICKSAKLADGDLKQINRFTRRDFTADELYAFRVVLCDNEIDRDFEQFTPQALKTLGELFVGKPGLFDHEPKAAMQAARIFAAEVCKVEGKTNTVGEPYMQLTARAYLPRTEDNRSLITEIESGIKKEVSVGCAVKKRVCSICGREAGQCSHVRGHRYGGKLCYFILDEPADAYEWSFVAVPAQRAAGVTKQFAAKPTERGEPVTLKTFAFMEPAALSLTEADVKNLQKELAGLEKLAEAGRRQREEQLRRIVRTAAVLCPWMPSDLLHKALEILDADELDHLEKAACRTDAGKQLHPQLTADNRKTTENKDFYI